MSESTTSELARAGDRLRPRVTPPPSQDLFMLRIGLELCDPFWLGEWLNGLDPASNYVVVSAVALSVPLKPSDLLAAIGAGRTRWVELTLELRRRAAPRPERG